MIESSQVTSSSPARELRRVSLSPIGDLSKFKSRRHQRLEKLRSLKYTCRTKTTTTTTKISLEEDGQSETKKITVVSLTEVKQNDVVSTPERQSDDDDYELGFRSRRYGVVSVIGKSREMEDAVRVELGFAVRGERKLDFFGVYDGHGGGHVAGTCRERLHEILAAEMIVVGDNGGGDWERVMEGCFGKMEEEVRGNAAARTVGTTAVAAVVAEDEVVVANCGDCRAVLCRDGVAIPLSIDHKPDRPDELERIEAAGGKVIHWNGYRVLGVLATSRSIGDQHLSPYVISKPEVSVTKRTDKDEFLILASDGLWDVISNEVACKIVKKCLQGKINSNGNGNRRYSISKEAVLDYYENDHISKAATVLTELAMAWGSRDNISVIVVDLRKL